jgi:hypothetical protein
MDEEADTERLRNLPNITQLLSGRVETQKKYDANEYF